MLRQAAGDRETVRRSSSARAAIKGTSTEMGRRLAGDREAAGWRWNRGEAVGRRGGAGAAMGRTADIGRRPCRDRPAELKPHREQRACFWHAHPCAGRARLAEHANSVKERRAAPLRRRRTPPAPRQRRPPRGREGSWRRSWAPPSSPPPRIGPCPSALHTRPHLHRHTARWVRQSVGGGHLQGVDRPRCSWPARPTDRPSIRTPPCPPDRPPARPPAGPDARPSVRPPARLTPSGARPAWHPKDKLRRVALPNLHRLSSEAMPGMAFSMPEPSLALDLTRVGASNMERRQGANS